jgi:hypothetical protein
MRSLTLISYTGCLLPFLIIFNLFFGWLFFRPLQWLLIELILVCIFVVNSWVMTKKIFSAVSKTNDKGVIDVEGEVVDDKEKKPID